MLAPITEIFCDIDDFCKDFLHWQSSKTLPLPNRKRSKECRLAISEIVTITIIFHLSHYRTFKDFYYECVLQDLLTHFPNAVSYNRFVELQASVITILLAYLSSKKGKETGMYIVDSTPLRVCNNRRIFRHKVFAGIAKRSKHSMGWFFGFKLHLIINNRGELIKFCLTNANIDDRKPLKALCRNLKGIIAGDKGYIGKKGEIDLAKQGLRLITKTKKNMKEKALSILDKYFLAKRGIVETVIDQLKALCQIEHTRHRSPVNFISNVLAALAAYTLRPRKPSIKIDGTGLNGCALMSS